MPLKQKEQLYQRISEPEPRDSDRWFPFKQSMDHVDADDKTSIQTASSMAHDTEVFSFFEHAKGIDDIVQKVANGDEDDVLSAIVRAQTTLAYYQEQSELLDPHLESMIAPLTAALLQRAVKGEEEDRPIRNICVLLQCFTKVRGHKSVIKFYPVEVKCFIPILQLLLKYQSKRGEGVWETQCQLMLWLSSLSLIPFDLRSLSTDDMPVVETIIEVTDAVLHEAGAVREFACLLLYRLLTRPDMETPLQTFLDGAYTMIQNIETTEEPLYAVGVMQTMTFTFKHGRRAALVTHARRFWPVVAKLMQSKVVEGSLMLRKLGVKLVQRLAMVLLEPVTPKWRYVLTTTRLGSAASATPPDDVTDDVNDDHYEIPDETEEVIQQLLTSVCDERTIVRWSASKGIGRVCSRLPKDLANEVLSSVTDLFSEVSDDNSWHGGCLSVAELARRGLLLPESIPMLVLLIEKALVYDVNRGNHSIGANVRDSACYVCWACARSFDAEIMRPFMAKLAPVLLTTGCLDREVNCRRAASAAFQECVGRIGNVPHGMTILQHADYFTLSNRANAYLSVTPAVASYKPYGFEFIAHLLYEKLAHWESALRQLTAEALGKLVEIDEEYFACDGLDYLLGRCLDDNLDNRHGACLGLATVVSALVAIGSEIPEDRLTGIANITVKIEKARLYRGKGGGLMRQAVCKIIESIAASNLTRSLKHRQRLLLTVNECICHPEPDVPRLALDALHALSREFLPEETAEAMKQTTKFYSDHLHSANVAYRRGYTMALGKLPRRLFSPPGHSILEKLSNSTIVEESEDDRDAESRANAVKALTEVVVELYPTSEDVLADREYLQTSVMETLFSAMDDYSLDRRGDVGSWIREAAMGGMRRVVEILSKAGALTDAISDRTVAFLLRNSVERIANIRQVAAQTLLALLRMESVRLPERQALESALLSPEVNIVSDFGSNQCISVMLSLLQFSVFSSKLMEGFVMSIGGLEKTLSEAASNALIGYLQQGNDETFDRAIETLMDLVAKHNKSKRMAAPMLMTVDVLFKSSPVFGRISDGHKAKIITKVRTAVSGTSDIPRLTIGASILSALAFHEELTVEAWKELLLLLVNRFPIVRKQTAEIIYERLLFQEDTPRTQDLSQVLLEAAWDGPLEQVRTDQEKLSEILCIQAPVRKIKTTKNPKTTETTPDGKSTYTELVDDFARGFK